jgi:hypothetical protein
MLAAALLFAPLPALCQGAQSEKAGGASSYAIQDSTTMSRGEIGNLLDRLSHSQLRDRLAAAADTVEEACAEDFHDLCGSIAPGEGRIVSCLRDHEDLLSRRCRLTLFLVSRKIRQTVANFADDCGNAIRTQCANAEKIGECAEQKSASISPACQTMVAALRHIGQNLSNIKGVTVYSSDEKDVGRVVDAKRGPDGKIQSVQIQIGRFLGLGDKVVSINAEGLKEIGDRIKLKLGSDQVRTLPEAK